METPSGYTNDFFKFYADYLKEPTVRKNHGRIFRDWFEHLSPHLIRAVDLGCGSGEFFEYGHVTEYVGIDEVPRTRGPSIAADYKSFDWIDKLPFQPNAFVSLFSIEPMMAPPARYDIYDQLFQRLPTLRYALVGGFYYARRSYVEGPIEEAGGITSWQTTERAGQYTFKHGLFDEEWHVIHTPSKMFGDDVFEVWKYFTRR